MKKNEIIIRIQRVKEENQKVFNEDLNERSFREYILKVRNKTLKQKQKLTYPLGYVGQKKQLIDLL